MKNYFNPKAKNLDFRITVSVEIADKAGWDCSDFYEASRYSEYDETGCNVKKETYEDARERVMAEETITVTIEGNVNNPDVFCYIGKEGYKEDTGDNEQSINDVIEWLESEAFVSYLDYTTDENDCYIPAFSQFLTMEDEKMGGFLVGKEIIKLK